jgi:hypothetical protein
MHIDKNLIPIYLEALRREKDLLSEAEAALEEGAQVGIDHTKMRWQAWNALCTLTPSILQSPGIFAESYSKIVKLLWITNFENAVAQLKAIENKDIKLQGEHMSG